MSIERKLANKRLRRAQRQQVATERCKRLQMLHDASESNSPLLFKIIQNQRKSKSIITSELILDGKTYTEDLMPAWVKHFSRLATPIDEENYNNQRMTLAEKNLQLLEDIIPKQNELKIPISEYEVKQAINDLK